MINYTRLISRLSLYSALVGSLAYPGLVQAQDSDDEDLDILDTVSLTGSRLSGAQLEGTLPISTYTKEDFELSAATTAVDFLRDLPITGGPSTYTSNFTNGTDGTQSVGLRALTGGNTLILFNGRRITPSGTGSSPNLYLIPSLNAIKEIEILKAGGSTVYGTSAVAGVINFILDDEFEGLEFNIKYGNTFDTDVHETQADFIVGGRGSDDKFSFVVSGQYREQAAMMAPDRPYMIGGGVSPTPNPGDFYFSGPATGGFTAIDQAIIDANGYNIDPADYPGGIDWTLKDGVTVANGPEDFQEMIYLAPYETDDQGRTGTMFPYENYTIALNPNKQYGTFATADYQVTDKLKFFTELGYAYSELTFQLAPAPTAFFMPDSNYWLNEIFSPADVAATEALWASEGYAGLTGYHAYRFVEVGPRINYHEFRSLRAVAGFELEVNEDWSVTGYYLYSDEKHQDSELNGGSYDLVDEMLGYDTPDAYNLFAASWVREPGVLGGGYVNPEAPNADLADIIRADNNTDEFSRTELIEVKASGQNLFALPGGNAEIAFGGEWRRQYAYSRPDALKLSGSLGWNAADGITEGGREVTGMFAELGLPILASDSAIGDVYLSLSGRYEDYKDEFTTDVFGAQLRWSPIADLTLRGSFSQGFMAPDLLDVYNPGFGSFPELNDPFYSAENARRLYQVETFYVGSQVTGVSLQPEESDIFSVGFTYSPSYLEGLDVTVDWWRIEQSNLIVYSVQGLVNEFRASYPGGSDGSETHPPANNPYLSTNGGPIVYNAANVEPIQQILNAGPRNISQANTEGIDFQVAYRFDTERAGAFRVEMEGSYYITVEQSTIDGSEFISYNGEYDGDVAYPRFKAQGRVVWRFGDFTTSIQANYIGESQDINVNPANPGGLRTHVPDQTTFDVSVRYVLPWFNKGLMSTTLTLGVDNVFDEDPPFTPTAFSNNYPERNYDPRGRLWYAALKQKF